MALAAEEGARYENCTVEGEAVTVRGDRRLLRRLIRNLIDNAERHGAPPVQRAVRRDYDTAVLEVTDGGAGIPEAERERVFSPFYRLQRDTQGPGSAWRWCGRSRGCMAATQSLHRAAIRRAASASRCRWDSHCRSTTTSSANAASHSGRRSVQ